MVRTLKVSLERKTFLVRFENESGGKWCSLTKHSRGSVSTLENTEEIQCPFNGGMLQQPWKVYKAFGVRLQQKGRQCREEIFIHKHVGPLYRSFTNVIREEGSRRGGLVPVWRWARAVVCECTTDCDNWVEVGRALARRLRQKGVVTIVPFSGRKVEKVVAKEKFGSHGKVQRRMDKIMGIALSFMV
ncbi:hypothetical protein CK203_104207 [Vitis vinifera]|uniref:Uncharacterized protein n=1 Tax=Vitis vinifera TaxID=29760 RepID=A0A438BN04_VITVI|nr:hypothetical protein CK203_104207 [Vitis vinifera]